MAKKAKYIPAKQFIAAVMKHRTAAGAARELGCSRQAVSKRVQMWRDKGVTGLPNFSKELDVDEVQELINHTKKGRSK